LIGEATEEEGHHTLQYLEASVPRQATENWEALGPGEKELIAEGNIEDYRQWFNEVGGAYYTDHGVQSFEDWLMAEGALKSQDEVEETRLEFQRQFMSARRAARTAAPGEFSNEEKIRNAETMFGTGSSQHKKALEKWGPGKKSHKTGSREKTALMPIQPQSGNIARIAGWDWDHHQSGYIAQSGIDSFDCTCGVKIAAPSFGVCECGKQWNIHTVQSASGTKMIAREVPVRADAVLASRT